MAENLRRRFATRQPRPGSTRELLRSWSERSNRLCLSDDSRRPDAATSIAAQSLAEEVAGRDPGSWEQAYLQNLRSIFVDEIACDTVFRVLGADGTPGPVVAKGHRSMLEARKCQLLTPTFANQGHEEEEVIVDDPFFKNHPELLRTAVAACYGIIVNESDCAAFVKGRKQHYLVDTELSNVVKDLSLLELMANDQVPRVDVEVKIVGSPAASSDNDTEWTFQCNVVILIAHSEYFRAALARQGWSTETEKKSGTASKMRILRLDSTHFPREVMQQMISSCYGSFRNDVFDIEMSLFDADVSLEPFLRLIDAATYLGMKATSLRLEEKVAKLLGTTNIADMMNFAEENGAQRLYLECHKFLCRYLKKVGNAGKAISQLQSHQLEAVLQSDFVDTPEDEILRVLLVWSEQTGASFDDTKHLLSFVRLPFVPLESLANTRASDRNLVGDDMLRVCRLFQTDGNYRAVMMNSEAMYRPRQTSMMKADLKAKLNPPLVVRRDDDDDFVRFIVMRMLGTVNGRENFGMIASVAKSESGNHVVCTFPESKAPPFAIQFPFGSIETADMPSTCACRPENRVDRSSLATFEVDSVKQLLAAMLKREDGLRLHPRIQSVFGSIGENEEEMSAFTSALQAHVAKEFNVDPVVGIELIRSATTLFPETAKLVHYVRHNRCFEGSLQVGNDAPDVSLLTLTGEPTTLWKEMNKRRHVDNKAILKPVVILGASFT